MYEVYMDGRILDYPNDEVNFVIDPELELALNDAGSLEFLLPPVNPEYGNIRNRQSVCTVMKDGEEIFSGVVMECGRDNENLKECYAVGELAYLADSIQPQAEYHDLSPRQMLETLLNAHNSQVESRKRFHVGIVTIHDTNDSLYRYTNREDTLGAIRGKLVEILGGYLRVRKSGGKRYLDWVTLADYGKVCSQPIMFGENLLDYSDNLSSKDVATAIIPLGARMEKQEGDIGALEKYTDITTVNNGKDYVYVQEAVDRFGWIKKVVKWNDVTIPENLKRKAEEWIRDNQYEEITLTVTAMDLSVLEADFNSFRLGDRAKAVAEPYEMDKIFPVQKMKVYLHDPKKNTLQLGNKLKKTYTESVSDSQKQANQNQEEGQRITTSWMQSAVDNLTQMMTGNEGGYKIEEYDDGNQWLRTLIMDAPDKGDAINVLQFNKYGIGGSHNGFNGPYTVGMLLDGTIIGERIKAGSVQAEALSVEYKSSVADAIDTTVTAKFKVAEGLISAEVKRATEQEIELAASIKVTSDGITAEVTRAKGKEAELAASIRINADAITSKVAKGEVESLIEQKADSIRLKAGKISWSSNYSSMSEAGKLSCQSADVSGIFRCGSYHYLKLDSGKIKGGYNGGGQEEQYGYIDYSASVRNISTGRDYEGVQVQGGCLRISVEEMATRKTSDVGTLAYVGGTGTMRYISDIQDNGDGTITWYTSSVEYENGLMVTSL